MLIEKNIHQIWVGEYDVPPRDKEFCEENQTHVVFIK